MCSFVLADIFLFCLLHLALSFIIYFSILQQQKRDLITEHEDLVRMRECYKVHDIVDKTDLLHAHSLTNSDNFSKTEELPLKAAFKADLSESLKIL